MRAVAINEFGGRDRLRLMDLPKPESEKGKILVEVGAAGVNPVGWKIREGMLEGRLAREMSESRHTRGKIVLRCGEG